MISDHHLELTEKAIAAARAGIAEYGLVPTVSSDFDRLRNEAAGEPEWPGLSATCDPDLVRLEPGRAWWLAFRDRDGALRACLANRLVETADLVQDYKANRLFCDRVPVLNWTPITVADNVPHLAGRIVLAVSMWRHPSLRGGHISGYLSRLARALSFRYFAPIDWYVALTVDSPRHQAWTSKGLGMNSATLSTGYYPPRRRDQAVRVSWVSPEELLSGLAASVPSEPSIAGAVR